MLHSRTHLLMLAATGVMLLSGALVAAQDIEINIGLGAPPAPPQLVVVPGTAVYYAPEAVANLFVYKGRYYTLVNNVWSTAPAYHGPWVVIQVGKVPPPILGVPMEYYNIPPGHLKQKGPPPWAGHGRKSKKSKD
jgi:hypothetical protein